MAIELGKAYVQIMPSAKGISGSIQKAIAPEALAAGKSAGRNIATAISDSLSKAGSTMSKYITAPAMTAATAVSGLVSALGFKRLVGMDEARAKLKGLGIEGKQLEIVMANAKNAVTGTTFTMADGVNVAAGALAAGVKEGAELERYIKLVGDAAIGANAPIAEMAQIFNRIQGQGKITRTELDMLEYRLPGFSQALMKHVGAGSQDAFFEMVRAGKVGTDDVLNTMETFAGGMAAAYAETWSGLKANVLANIGIIGEALLEGLFKDGKKGLADFLQFLRESEGLKQWARDTGETLRNVFTTIVESIKSAIDWWTNLSDGAKAAFLTIAGIAVAIGPVMMAISKLITFAGVVGAAIGGISAPVLIVIGVIAGLIALFVTLYRRNERFRDLVHNVWNAIKETISTAIQVISDFVMQVWGRLVEWWNTHGDMILQAAQNVWNAISTVITTVMNVIWNIMQALWPVIQVLIVSTWEAIKGVIQGAINVITGIIDFFAALFTGNWSALWDAVKQIVSGAVQLVWNLVQLWFVGKIVKVASTFGSLFRNVIQTAWNFVKNIFTTGVNLVRNVVSTGFNFIRNIISSVMNTVRSIISSIWNGIKSTVSSVVNSIRNTVSNIFNSLHGIVSNAFSRVSDAVRNGINRALDIVRNIKDKFFDAGRNIVTSIADGIKSAISKVTDAIGSVTQKVRNFLPFSPPKEGPLIDIMDIKWGETIAAGIEKGENEIARAMERVLAFDVTRKASFSGSANANATNITNMGGRYEVVITLDGREVARATAPHLEPELERRRRMYERARGEH
jgi:phage-related protein